MPKKLFPQIQRQGAARLGKHAETYFPDSLKGRGMTSRGFFSDRTRDHWRKQMGRGRREDRTMLYQPVKNGENDALTITCVLDLLMRVDHDAYTFSAGLTKLLGEEYGDLVWFDPYTVGRILKQLLGAQPALERHHRPMELVMWGGARQYVVRWDDANAWRWLAVARDRMGKRAEADQEALRDPKIGPPAPRTEDTWLVLEGIWEEMQVDKVSTT